MGAPTANNLAGWFTPRIPMCGPEYDPEKMVTLSDTPVKLARALKDGMEPIGIDCIKQNAQFVFHFYETICVEHVLSMQMQNRLVRQLTQRDPDAAESTERRLVPEGMLARSSLIGKDICGDTPRPDPESSDSSSGEDAAPVEKPQASAKDSATLTDKSKKKKKKKYTGLQLLQIEVQDKTYLYLTVHVFHIVDPFFRDLLKNQEIDYKANKDSILINSARNRMS